uniref:Reverse transcriptase domain-containing protein n=1 Tax=Fagus sylvatica TaxID=28930 RepID=A0A2N9F6N4_FAGSY
MNEDDLSARLQKVNLTNEEEDNIVITAANRGSALEECSLSLLGRFLTQKPINFRVARSTLRLAWRMGDDVRIVEVGNGLLQFRFAHAFQMKWVMEHEPWNFDNHLLILRPREWGLDGSNHNIHPRPLLVQRVNRCGSSTNMSASLCFAILVDGWVIQCKFVLIPLLQPVMLLHWFYLMESGCVLHQAANQYSSCSLRGGVSQSSPHPTTNPVRDDGTLRTPPATVVDATQESLAEGLQIPTNPGLGDTVIKTYADTSVPRDIPIIAKDNLESTENNKENLCPSILENAIPTITVPINEPSLENLEESTPYLPAQSDLFYHNSRTPLTSVTDSILNTPVLHNHYHNQFAEIQERIKIYGTWKRAIKMEGDMPPYTHAEHPPVGSKRGRDEELAEGTGSGKTSKKGWLGNPKAIRALHEMVQSKVPSILFLIETKMDNSEMTVVRSRLGFHNALIVPSMGFYGFLEEQRKHESWRLLEHLGSMFSLPWLCVGDFNEILEQSEKRGLLDQSPQRMLEFRCALNSCQLIDIGYHGPTFTWDNGRHGAANVQERLDRATATLNWLDKFHGTIVHNVPWSSSDHLPLLIECGSTPSPVQTERIEFETKTKALEVLRLDNHDGKNDELIRDLNSEINAHLHKEEIHWRQRSRAEEASSVAHTTEQYFKDIFFNKVIPPRLTILLILWKPLLLKSITPTLLLKFKAEEVRARQCSKCPLPTSPGPDGRLITDNVAVAYELMHTMRSKWKGKVGYLAMKLDMSKTYDRVEWAFLKAAMLKMGFAQHWVDLVMECVSTPTYSILINGVPQGYIHPSRGVRQGDPLSSFIFLICAEGLSSLIRKAELAGLIHSISASRRGQSEKSIGLTGPLCVNQRHGIQGYSFIQSCSLSKTSFLAAQDLLRRGSRWQIRNGACINIFGKIAGARPNSIGVPSPGSLEKSETVTHTSYAPVPWLAMSGLVSFSLVKYRSWPIRKTKTSLTSLHLLRQSSLNQSFEQWAMICWAIWNSRNRFMFEGVQDHPSRILESASKLLNDYQGAYTPAATRSF